MTSPERASGYSSRRAAFSEKDVCLMSFSDLRWSYFAFFFSFRWQYGGDGPHSESVVLTLLWQCGVAANLSFSPGSRSCGTVCQHATQPTHCRNKAQVKTHRKDKTVSLSIQHAYLQYGIIAVVFISIFLIIQQCFQPFQNMDKENGMDKRGLLYTFGQGCRYSFKDTIYCIYWHNIVIYNIRAAANQLAVN